jgi:dipeptidyl aminopeptidase/acylaminoacyl peptidase
MMKRTVILLATTMIFWGSSLPGSEPRPLTFNDFIRIQRVSDPNLSPDGQLIAFVVAAVDKAANRSNSDIWIVPARGGEIQRLTSSPQADFNPRWSPDGRKIAFISTRSGSAQVWMIPVAGGEATQVTNISTGATGVAWSPKGNYLLFISSVFPDCPDDDCNRKKTEAAEASKVKARIYDSLLYRHWNSWADGTRSHLFAVPLEGGQAIDLTPGDYDTPPLALGGALDYAVSPDGSEVCFVRNIDSEFRLSLGTNNDIFTVPIKGGEIRAITSNRANDNNPLYSPDGRFIAYRAMARPGFEADKYSLILYDRSAQKITNLTDTLDYSVDELLWSSDSSALFFTAEDKGRMAVFKVSLADPRPEKIIDGRYMTSLTVSPDGKSLIFLKQAIDQPADIFALSLESKEVQRLTDINRELLSRIRMNPAEEFWFEGGAREKIHGFLLKPPSFDPSRKYPLVMLIHGGPQGAWNDNFHYRWNAQMFASPGYVVAMINFHGSTGYGQRFTDSISGDWGGKPYQDIMLGLDYLLATYPFIEKTRLAAAGASYGGYMIDWIEGQTARFQCLISHSGVFDLRSMHGSTEELWFPEWEFRGTPWTSPQQYEKWSPSSYVGNFKTPCLVIHSQNDFRVPLSQGLQFFTSLQRMRVPSKLLYFPDEDHFIQKPQNAELWWATDLDSLQTY